MQPFGPQARVFILDPALSLPVGHHLNFHRSLADEFGRRGIQTIHLIHRDCADTTVNGLRVGKLFRQGPYAWLSTDPLISAWESFFTHADLFQADMDAIPAGMLTPEDIVLLPVVSPGMLFGYVRWWGSLDPALRPHTVIIFQMLSGVLSLDPLLLEAGTASRDTARLYRFIGNQIAALPEDKLHFATVAPQMAAHYAFLLNRTVAVHPLHSFAELADIIPIAQAFERSNAPPTFGYFGDNRTDKGYALLPGTLEIMLDRHPTLQFTIQTSGTLTTSDAVNAVMIETAQCVHEMAARTSRISLLNGFAQACDFYAAIARVDFVLQPYKPIPYGLAPSGIFNDVTSIGRTSVVPANTWMAQQVEALGGFGAIHRDYEPTSIAEAALTLVTRTMALRQQAEELRYIWRGLHGTARMVDCLLKEIVP